MAACRVLGRRKNGSAVTAGAGHIGPLCSVSKVAFWSPRNRSFLGECRVSSVRVARRSRTTPTTARANRSHAALHIDHQQGRGPRNRQPREPIVAAPPRRIWLGCRGAGMDVHVLFRPPRVPIWHLSTCSGENGLTHHHGYAWTGPRCGAGAYTTDN